MIKNKDKDALHKKLFNLAFAKRPAFELYDLKKDPDQLENVASVSAYAETLKKLSKRLNDALKASKDPRVLGDGDKFDSYKYSGGVPRYPGFKWK